jgi:hypothetical protein
VTEEGLEHWWTDNCQGETEVLGQNPVAGPLFHHKSHTDCPRFEPQHPRWEAGG